MSIRVELSRLAETLGDFDHAYLLTPSADGVIKVNTVDTAASERGVVIDAGGMMQARLNIAANPTVTLVWPPRVFHGHTLIVDGTASATADEIVIVPATAILHRPDAHADGPVWADRETCVQDCRDV